MSEQKAVSLIREALQLLNVEPKLTVNKLNEEQLTKASKVLTPWIALRNTQWKHYWDVHVYGEDTDLTGTFFKAAHKGHRDVCIWLLKARKYTILTPKFVAPFEKPDLHDAKVVCQVLNECGYTPNSCHTVFNYVHSALAWGAKFLNIEIYDFVKAWIMETLSISAAQIFATKALRHAIVFDRLEICQHLKSWGLTLENIRADNNWLLKRAAALGHAEICSFLMRWCFAQCMNGHMYSGCKSGLTLNDIRSSGAFFDAALNGHVNVLVFFKNWNESIEGRNTMVGLTLADVRKEDNRALRVSAAIGNVDVLKFLKDWQDPNGDKLTIKDIKTTDMFGIVNAPFVRAAEQGHIEVLKFLQAWRDLNGDKLSIADVKANKNQAFRFAAYDGRLEVCQFLKAWRDFTDDSVLTVEDIRSKDNEALVYAARLGHDKIVQLLLDWTDTDGSRLSIEDLRSRNNSALTEAAGNGHIRVLELLKNWKIVGPDGTISRLTKADVETNNNVAMREAIRNGHINVTRFLLDWIQPPQESCPL